VTDFQRHVRHYVSRLKRNRTPLVLTVNGRAELVVQDARSYQELLQRLERAEAVSAIKQAMTEFDRGEGRPARQALEELRKRHGVSR
jgi:hypothetical protein